MVKKGDPIISIHIPQGEKLTLESVRAVSYTHLLSASLPLPVREPSLDEPMQWQ